MRSPEAAGRIVSHEAIYRWIYALPKSELAKFRILLRSNRIPHKTLGESPGGRIVGMVSIDDSPDDASDRGFLVRGKGI